jgi:Na+/H+-translocating membrane pyrophosphatase
MPNMPLLFLALPLFCIITILVGIYHLRRIVTEKEPLHESIAALSSYLSDAIFVFLKRQIFLIVITIAILVLGSVALSRLDIHESSLALFIVWGLAWSCVIGYFAIRKSTQITGDLLQQSLTNTPLWEKNIGHMGWALTLMPLGILSFLLSIWLTVFQIIVKFNFFHSSQRLMTSAGISGEWHPGVFLNPAFQNMYQSELSVILLAFCFGAMVQTFLVRVTTQNMCHATDRACKQLDYFYPGTDANDLRNPISMAHHIGHYADQVWGKISVMINTYLTVLLTAIAIMVAALRDSPTIYELNMVKAPLQIACVGLLAASMASFRKQESLFHHALVSSSMMGLLSLVAFGVGMLPIKALFCVIISLIFSVFLFYLKEKKDQKEAPKDILFQGLLDTGRVFIITLAWLGTLFAICHNGTNVLLGLDGMALGLVTVMSSRLFYIAFLHKTTFVTITINNTRILQVDKDLSEKIKDLLHAIQRYRPFTLFTQTLLTTGSLLCLFFIFCATLPYWLQRITHPKIHHVLSSVSDKHLSVFTLHDIENALGISPTNTPFLVGFFLSILVVIGLGVFWIWRVSQSEITLVLGAKKQLDSDDRLLKGEQLPSYQEGVQMATTNAYKSSFGLAVVIGIGTLIITGILGFGGLSGLVIGMIFCSTASGFYAFCHAQWGNKTEPELAASLIGLVTQAILLFSILFGAILLYVGQGL